VEELVFAIPTGHLWTLLPYTEKGLIKGNSDVLNRIMQNGLFRERSELEENPAFKQIIPYAILSNKESFSYSGELPGRRRKDYTINFTWEQVGI